MPPPRFEDGGRKQTTDLFGHVPASPPPAINRAL
jgi:hypothetical protein